jgi:FMN-dependent NADH-azoreductase
MGYYFSFHNISTLQLEELIEHYKKRPQRNTLQYLSLGKNQISWTRHNFQ